MSCDSSQYEYCNNIEKELISDFDSNDSKINSREYSDIESEFINDNDVEVELENNKYVKNELKGDSDVQKQLNDNNDIEKQITGELKYGNDVRQEFNDNINVGQKLKNDSTTVRIVLKDELECDLEENVNEDPMLMPPPLILSDILSLNTIVTVPDCRSLPNYELIDLPKIFSQCYNESSDNASTSTFDEGFIHDLSNNQIPFNITDIDKPDDQPNGVPIPRIVKVEFTVNIPKSRIKQKLKAQLKLNVSLDRTTIIYSETRRVQKNNNKVNSITRVTRFMSSEIPRFLKQFYGLPCPSHCHPSYNNPNCYLHAVLFNYK